MDTAQAGVAAGHPFARTFPPTWCPVGITLALWRQIHGLRPSDHAGLRNFSTRPPDLVMRGIKQSREYCAVGLSESGCRYVAIGPKNEGRSSLLVLGSSPKDDKRRSRSDPVHLHGFA